MTRATIGTYNADFGRGWLVLAEDRDPARFTDDDLAPGAPTPRPGQIVQVEFNHGRPTIWPASLTSADVDADTDDGNGVEAVSSGE